MKGLLYVAAFYGATSVGSLVGFAGLCIQAARRDKRAKEEQARPVPTVPTQRPKPRLDESDLLRAYMTMHEMALHSAGQQLADEAEQYVNSRESR